MTEDLETQVRQDIADILNLQLDDVQPEDDFLALGGASLAIIELASRVQSTYGVELSMDAIFEATSIREIVGALRAELAVPGA